MIFTNNEVPSFPMNVDWVTVAEACVIILFSSGFTVITKLIPVGKLVQVPVPPAVFAVYAGVTIGVDNYTTIPFVDPGLANKMKLFKYWNKTDSAVLHPAALKTN